MKLTQSDGRAAGKSCRPLAIGVLIVLAVVVAVGILASTRGSSLRRPEREPKRLSELMSETIETRGIGAAVVQHRSLREEGFPGLSESEADTNRLGYQLLRKGEKESAIRVFQVNVEAHPRSANVYDSLGEAYLAAGNEVLAIENYKKAVAIDPKKKSAIAALQRLTDYKREPYPPMVLFHIGAGVLGVLSGAVAISLRKGSRRHGAAGSVFFVSMLSMSASGAYMALVDPHGVVINVLMGVLTFYLVATAWLTARRRHGRTGILDWAALLVALAVAAGLARYGLEAASSPTGTRDGIPAAVYLVFGTVALLAGALDLRMIVRGGVFGAQRIARHLWRMCAALFIAVTSLFLGQPQVFPDAVRSSGLLAVPSLLVVILLVFWLIRVLFTSRYKRAASRESKVLVGQAVVS